MWDACLSDIAIGKELGVPAAQVAAQPPEYVISAILKLRAERILHEEEAARSQRQPAKTAAGRRRR